MATLCQRPPYLDESGIPQMLELVEQSQRSTSMGAHAVYCIDT